MNIVTHILSHHKISIVSIFHNNRKLNQNHFCEFFVSNDLFFHFRTITFFISISSYSINISAIKVIDGCRHYTFNKRINTEKLEKNYFLNVCSAKYDPQASIKFLIGYFLQCIACVIWMDNKQINSSQRKLLESVIHLCFGCVMFYFKK